MVILVYDVSRPDSFEKLDSHLKEAERFCDDAKFLILGNKLDLGCKVNKEEVEQWVSEKEFPHFQVSAKDGTNLEKAFLSIFQQENPQPIKATDNKNTDKKKKDGKKCSIF